MITGGWASLSVVLRKMRRGSLSLSRVLWNDSKRVLLKVKGCETIGVPLCELEAFPSEIVRGRALTVDRSVLEKELNEKSPFACLRTE